MSRGRVSSTRTVGMRTSPVDRILSLASRPGSLAVRVPVNLCRENGQNADHRDIHITTLCRSVSMATASRLVRISVGSIDGIKIRSSGRTDNLSGRHHRKSCPLTIDGKQGRSRIEHVGPASTEGQHVRSSFVLVQHSLDPACIEKQHVGHGSIEPWTSCKAIACDDAHF